MTWPNLCLSKNHFKCYVENRSEQGKIGGIETSQRLVRTDRDGMVAGKKEEVDRSRQRVFRRWDGILIDQLSGKVGRGRKVRE